MVRDEGKDGLTEKLRLLAFLTDQNYPARPGVQIQKGPEQFATPQRRCGALNLKFINIYVQ